MRVVRLKRPSKLALPSFISLGLQLASLHAATFLVTNKSDSGVGSLRQAILDSNVAGDGRIAFASVTGTITLASALPQIVGNTTINGPGTNLLNITGQNIESALSVSKISTCRISGVSFVSLMATNYCNGAAISNAGSLFLSDCIFTNNFTRGFGGAIYNSGNLEIRRSAFTGNTAGNAHGGVSTNWIDGAGGGGAGLGGALFAATGAVLLRECVFTGNSAVGGNLGGDGSGMGNRGGGMNGGLRGGGAGGFGGGGGGGAADFGSGGNGGFGAGGGSGAGPGYPNFAGPAGVPGLFGGYVGGGAGIGGAVFVQTGDLEISRCTFSGNRVVGGNSGGFAIGGAVYVDAGSVLITDSAISGGRASTGSGGSLEAGHIGLSAGGAMGAGVYVRTANVAIVNSTFAANQIKSGDGGNGTRYGGGSSGQAAGAGLFVEDGVVSLTNVTVSGNRAEAGNNGGGALIGGPPIPPVGGPAFGAGMYVKGGVVSLVNCTLTSNQVIGGPGVLDPSRPQVDPRGRGLGGGIANDAGTVRLLNTIIAANIAMFGTNSLPDLSGSFASQGFNLIGNTNGSLGVGTSDLLNANANLDALQDNGGATSTHSLLIGSPAINAGAAVGAPNLDQRGFPRPVGGAYDIGAYEFGSGSQSISLEDSKVGIRLFVEPNLVYPLQASTNLFDWQTIATIPASPNHQFVVEDPAHLPMRFYRLLLSP